MSEPEDRELAETGGPPADGEEELELGLLPLLDAEAGPARPLSEREQLLLVDRIERQFAQRRRVLPWRAPRRVVLVGALFAASAAAAIYGVGVLSRDPAPPGTPSEPVPSEAVPSEPVLAQPLPQEPLRVEPVLAQPVAPALPDPEASERPSSAASSAPTAPPTSERGEEIAGDRPAKSAAAASKWVPGGTPEPQVSRSGRAAGADRLAAASALRARHRYREALALYLQVIELDPDGMQASVARVAAAEVQLDHLGDTAGAERLYREAKTQGGELTAEAQFGLAQVARARGDATSERLALQDFLSRHPGSPLVSAARRRLSALGAR
ncbi:MAG: hypothetical protein RL033_6381 [Pseudomonadota bacterium]